MPSAPMVAIDMRTDAIVEIGDTVTSFRGETATLQAITRAAVPGKSGKVSVGGREYYDKVWGLRIVALAPCGCVISASADCMHAEFGVASS